MPDLNFADFIDTTTTQEAYACSVARMLQSLTEQGHDLLTEAVHVKTMDPADVRDYVASLSSDFKNTKLPYFPADDTIPGKLVTVQDFLVSYGEEVDVEGVITYDEALAISNDLAGSLAATDAAAIAATLLSSSSQVSQSDFIGAIEAQLGGISDEMLNITSVIAPVLSSPNTPLVTKIKVVLGSLGLYNTAYSGYGALPSDLSDMTNCSGLMALLRSTTSLITTPIQWVAEIGATFLAGMDRILGGVISKVGSALSNFIGNLAGTSDAVIQREEGKFLDVTCDNATSSFIINRSLVSSTLYNFLNTQYAVHFTLGFGTIDLWIDSTTLNVNCAIHWKPIDYFAVIDYVNSYGGYTYDLSDDSNHGLESASGMCNFLNDLQAPLYEAETREDLEAVLDRYGTFFNSLPESGALPFGNGAMYYGLWATQVLVILMLLRIHGTAVEWSTHEPLLSYLEFSFTSFSHIHNKDLAIRGSLTYIETGHWVDEVSSQPYNNSIEFLFLHLIEDACSNASTFSFFDPVNSGHFTPYFYISEPATGMFSIKTDSQLMDEMKDVLKIVGAVVITILSFKVFLKLRKTLWIAQTSLDYRSFEADVATNSKLADELYSKSKRVALAQNLMSIVCGTAKTVAVKAFTAVKTLVYGLVSAVTGSVKGSNAATGAIEGVDLNEIKELISG